MTESNKNIAGLYKCRFSYGPGMQSQWVENNRIFLAFVASKYGQSTRASFLANEVVATEVEEDLIPKFDTEEEEKAHLANLKYWEQKLYHSTIEDNTKFSRIIRKDLATIYGVLFELCKSDRGRT